MTIVNTTKFIIGIVLLLVGAALLWTGRGTRGFNQKRQAGVLSLGGAAIMLAIGLGLIEI